MMHKSLRHALLLVFGLALSTLGDDQHLGPVVSVVAGKGGVYSASQAGVFVGQGSNAKRLLEPGFRVFGMAVVPRRRGVPERLVLVGGRPGEDGMIALFDAAQGKLEQRRVADDVVYDVAVSPDGRTVALACADNRVLILAAKEFAQGELRERHRHTADARAVAWSPDGSRLVSGGLDGVLLTSKADGAGDVQILQQHSAGVEALTFSPDGLFFASGSRDAKVRIHTEDGVYVRAYSGLGMEAMRSGLERKPHVVGLVWGGKRGDLIAGASTGGLYRLATSNANWEKLDWRKRGALFCLAIDTEGGIVAGMDGSIARADSGRP